MHERSGWLPRGSAQLVCPEDRRLREWLGERHGWRHSPQPAVFPREQDGPSGDIWPSRRVWPSPDEGGTDRPLAGASVQDEDKIGGPSRRGRAWTAKRNREGFSARGVCLRDGIRMRPIASLPAPGTRPAAISAHPRRLPCAVPASERAPLQPARHLASRRPRQRDVSPHWLAEVVLERLGASVLVYAMHASTALSKERSEGAEQVEDAGAGPNSDCRKIDRSVSAPRER